LEQRREFMDFMAEKLNIQDKESWYNVTKEDIISNGGSRMLSQIYENDLCLALQSIYEDVDWEPWRFVEKVSISPQRIVAMATRYLEYLGETYNLSARQNYCGLTRERFEDSRYGRNLLKRHGGSLLELLKEIKPDYQWISNQWYLHSNSRSQSLLGHIVRSLFPVGTEIECQVKIPIFPSKIPSFFDVWIPQHNVALEYQGIQHYKEIAKRRVSPFSLCHFGGISMGDKYGNCSKG
jgi:hypothetical protein